MLLFEIDGTAVMLAAGRFKVAVIEAALVDLSSVNSWRDGDTRYELERWQRGSGGV